MPEPEKMLLLNVDDDESGRYAMSRVLQQAGFDVKEAATGLDALRVAAQTKPDLILLDVHLPDIDGFEVCRRLKSTPETQSIPVVHITASYGETSHKTRGLDSGADGYLVEPVDPAFLIASVKSMLRVRDAERQVRKFANAWQSTFDSIQDGIAVLNSDGKVMQANARFRALFPDGEFEGVIASGTNPIPLKEVIGRVERNGDLSKWEIKRGDASLEISLNGIQDSSETRGGICIIRDVTERNRIEENLRFTQKLESIGVLAGGIAHDFNNLLTGILGNASLALDEQDLPSHIRPILQQVVTSSERAADLTRQLLAYAGKGRFFEESIDLSALIRETLSLIRTNLVTTDVRLKLDRALPMIRADATQIRQLAMNLILNASEATGAKGGWISIKTSKTDLDPESLRSFADSSLSPGTYISLEVQDSGSGMDEATQKRIFDPFFTTKFLGRGLGLSATLGIVRSHGGAIRVVSAPGKGSLFQVLLPVIPAKDEKQAPETDPAPAKGTVLIVEDEEPVRMMMKAVLERDGLSVLIAVNGVEAVKLFREANRSIDLVIVDLTMPVMNGDETIEALLALNPAARIIVCTGHSVSEVSQSASVGVLGVIAKPFRGSTLRSEVRKHLHAKAPASH